MDRNLSSARRASAKARGMWTVPTPRLPAGSSLHVAIDTRRSLQCRPKLVALDSQEGSKEAPLRENQGVWGYALLAIARRMPKDFWFMTLLSFTLVLLMAVCLAVWLLTIWVRSRCKRDFLEISPRYR